MHRSFPIAFLAIAFPCSALRLQAALVSATNLFLAPSSVPEAYYNANSFSFGGSSSITETLTPGSFGLTSFTGVQMLPVLKPDFLTSTGDYTPGDLAAINSSNFGSYFYLQPGVNYTADLTSSQITLNYMAAGAYFVQVDGIGPMGATSSIFEDQVDDFIAEDPAHGVKDKQGPSRTITNPSADLILLSDGDPNDNGFLKSAAATLTNAGTGFTKVNSVNAVVTAIQNAYNANGKKKISVVLMGHGFGGAQGGIKIGTEYITNIAGYTTPGDFQKMIDQYASSVSFWSCNTGQDMAFLQAVANSIGKASGFATTISAASPALFGLLPGYFNQGALGKKGEADAPVPEPGTFWLLGAVAASLYGWRKAGVSNRSQSQLSSNLEGTAHESRTCQRPQNPGPQQSDVPRSPLAHLDRGFFPGSRALDVRPLRIWHEWTSSYVALLRYGRDGGRGTIRKASGSGTGSVHHSLC